jgi:HK97 family phage major capsid protein
VTNVYLKAKIEERTSQASVLDNLQKTAADEKRDLTEDERKTFDSIVGRLQFLDAEIKRIADAEEGAAKFVQVYSAQRDAQAKAAAAREREREREAQQSPEERDARKSWGTRFVESREFHEYSGHGASAAFTIAGEFLEERASWTFGPGQNVMAAGMGEAVPVQQWAGPREAEFRTPLFDVIGRVPTSMGSIEYMYWEPGDEDNMASEVPEGQVKPEATLAGELKAVPISTYAWWKGITRQALDDVPQIRAVIDTFLRRGVIRKINAEAGRELTADTNIGVIGTGDDDLLAVIRAGVAAVDTNGYGVNAVLLNPMDWAAIDIQMLRLTGGGTNIQGAFWGLRPVALPSLASGSAYVGDFNEAVTFFDRQQTQVLITDSHADYFLRNKMILLAEARGKVAVTNAAAVVRCTGAVPPLTFRRGATAGDGAGGEGAAARSGSGRRGTATVSPVG